MILNLRSHDYQIWKWLRSAKRHTTLTTIHEDESYQVDRYRDHRTLVIEYLERDVP